MSDIPTLDELVVSRLVPHERDEAWSVLNQLGIPALLDQMHRDQESIERLVRARDQQTDRADELAKTVYELQRLAEERYRNWKNAEDRLTEAEESNERLREDAAWWQDQAIKMKRRWKAMADARRELADDWTTQAQSLTEAEEALAFYANPDTYFAIAFFPDPPCGEFIEDFDVPGEEWDDLSGKERPGKRARAYFAKQEDTEPGWKEEARNLSELERDGEGHRGYSEEDA